MTTYNRNDIWRLKRTLTHLDKALDNLTRAGGELRPKQFDKLRDALQGIANDAEALHIEIAKATKAPATFDLDDDKEAAE